MSNHSSIIGHYKVFNNQSLLRPTASEHRSSKLNSTGIPANSLFQSARRPLSSFYGNSLRVRKSKLGIAGARRSFIFTPRAVLAMDPPSEQLAGRFNLDGNIEMQVFVSHSSGSSIAQVNIQINYSSDSLLLHWGVVRDRKEKWVLPSLQPDGTKNYKNRALRSPFMESGSNSYINIAIDDPAIQAIEFLIVDEAQNKWFKNNGQNFYVELPTREKLTIPNVSVPEELVQIQSYLRWERNGKQMYTPEQEKEEYEAARFELMEKVARGTSIEDLRATLTNKNDIREIKEPSVSQIENNLPDDLVQLQAYMRWEKAGKPNFSPEQQQSEFEKAREELQAELGKGVSVDEIRKKISKGEIKTNVSKQLQNKRYFSTERIQRKGRDLAQLINRHSAKSVEDRASKSVEEKASIEPKVLKAVELFAKEKEEHDGGAVLNKKIFKLADKELLVLVTKPGGKLKVRLATDFEEPVTLHWALSKKAGEWMEPPPTVLPPGSVALKEAAETQLKNESSAKFSYQVWASKWNERAYFSARKVKLDHDYLCMAVLVQEVINADYAFVIHTTNPSSGDSSEIYAEVVKGLGETLVGAYPGRALSFICKKNDLNSPQVLGYPSKPIGLFIRRSIIFRSDSNGEDLEGYAGAGLYDSVPMDEEEKVVLDYSSDPLITDEKFRRRILSGIARAGSAIEELYGSPQDIEGVIRDGNVYVVQTRPQV
ncbi:hypothetical protein BDE02_10G037700 [Populus trichocarpa]|nr:hypothetical protein BDE02_10G037700 [Populus trichocarpa]